VRLRELLADRRRVQLDGGLSTALEELGADLDDPLWTARILRDQPELVLAAHRAFVEAGAEVVISASYQAPDELLVESVRIAREAGVLVAASVAPYGASLAGGQEYTGDYEIPTGWHERRVALLLAAEPDFLAIETQPRADEAAYIASLVHDLDCWVTFTCRDGACDVTELQGDGADGSFTAQGRVALRQPLQQSLLDLTVTVIPGAGFAQKAASLSLPPFQPGTPLTFKLVGPIMSARVAL